MLCARYDMWYVLRADYYIFYSRSMIDIIVDINTILYILIMLL